MEYSPEFVNRSSNPDIVLLGLSAKPHIREALFAIFLTFYLLILLENALIIYLTCSRHELCRPMYFFLGNLSGLEMCYVSVTRPTLLVGLKSGVCHVSFPACMVQLFLFLALTGTECMLLASMAYDRCVAICSPLHYPLRMRPPPTPGGLPGPGLGLRAGRAGGLGSPDCGRRELCPLWARRLNHFCDAEALQASACGPVTAAALADALAAGAWLAALAAYAAILGAITRLPSAAARRALVACASHLAVMGVFYSALLLVDSRRGNGHSADLDKALPLLYTAVKPACSPLVYCLRHREVHDMRRRLLRRPTRSREN